MNRNLSIAGLLMGFAILVVGTRSADADVIYDGGSPLLSPAIAQGALFSDTGNFNFSNAADQFSLSAGLTTVRDIHWWGTYGETPGLDEFSIAIYNDNGGTVGSLASFVSITSLHRESTTTTINGRTMYAYDATVSAVTLAPSTTYWLAIQNTSGFTGNNAWAWVISANTGNARQYSSIDATWGNTTNKSLAFNLTNDIPEPSSSLLAATGLAALFFLRRRKSHASGKPGEPRFSI